MTKKKTPTKYYYVEEIRIVDGVRTPFYHCKSFRVGIKKRPTHHDDCWTQLHAAKRRARSHDNQTWNITRVVELGSHEELSQAEEMRLMELEIAYLLRQVKTLEMNVREVDNTLDSIKNAFSYSSY